MQMYEPTLYLFVENGQIIDRAVFFCFADAAVYRSKARPKASIAVTCGGEDMENFSVRQTQS